MMLGMSFMAVWIEPLAQRRCWDLNPEMTTGSSAGQTISGT